MRQVEEHLKTCAECAGEYRFESSLLDEIRSKLQRIKASPEVLEASRPASRRPGATAARQSNTHAVKRR